MRLEVTQDQAKKLKSLHGTGAIETVINYFFETDSDKRKGDGITCRSSRPYTTKMHKNALLHLGGTVQEGAIKKGSPQESAWIHLLTYFADGKKEPKTRSYLTKKLAKDMDIGNAKVSSYISFLVKHQFLLQAD